MKKTNCYFYFEFHDMGAHIPCCTFEEYPLGKCPCDECTNYLPKKEASKIVREYLKNKGSNKEICNTCKSAQPNLQQTCNKLATDCISRQAVLDEIDDVSDVCEEIGQIEWCAELRTRVISLPSADRPTGEWHKTENEEMEITGYYCSVCDMPTNEPTNFCPNCGADMRGEEENHDRIKNYG